MYTCHVVVIVVVVVVVVLSENCSSKSRNETVALPRLFGAACYSPSDHPLI